MSMEIMTGFTAHLSIISYNTCWKQHDSNRLLVDEFYIICWEQAKHAIRANALPPTLIYLIDVGDDLCRIKGYLGVISCKRRASKC